MSDPDRVFVIFNPASGRGRGQRRIPRYREFLDRYVPGWAHAFTERAGDESRLVDRALDESFDTIIAMGGDGTWSHVADRILARGRTDVRLGVLPGGTGNDFCRNLGLREDDLEGAVRSVATGLTVAVDAGRVVSPLTHDEHAGGPVESRHFLNVVGFGFDVAVVDAARGARFFKGALLYKLTALQQLFRFPGFDVEIGDDGDFERSGHGLMLTVSNGRFFGGGFPIAPGATVTDGALHASFIRDAGPLVRLRLFDRASKGRHVTEPQVELHTAPTFEMRFPSPVRLEMDGDVYVSGTPVVRLEVMPGALQVIVPRAGH